MPTALESDPAAPEFRASTHSIAVLRVWRRPEIVAPAVVALALGLYSLGDTSWWWDEAYDLALTRAGWLKYVAKAAYYEPGQFAYLIVLKLWRIFTPETEWFTRFPSVIFASAAAATVGVLGKRLFGTLTGVVAGILMATNATMVQWSQATRTYALASFAAAVVTLLFLRALESDDRGPWLAYGIAGAVGFYAHFFVGLVLAAHAVLIPRLSVAQRRRLLEAWAIIFVAFLPAAPFIAIGGRGGLEWIPPTSWHGLRHAISAVSGFNAVLLGAAAAGTAILLTSQRHVADRWKGLLLVAWAVVPFVGALLASVLQPFLVDRYLLVTSPALALLAARALTAIRPRWLAAGVGIALVAVSARELRAWYRSVPSDWRAAARYASAEERAGVTVALYPAGSIDAYRLYAPMPAACRTIPGHTVPRCDYRASGHRTLVLTTKPGWRQELPGSGGYRVVSRRSFPGGIRALLLEQR
jgi:4-amino-4-deoxy-L-arabinose transferase-like glycosyltransferase